LFFNFATSFDFGCCSLAQEMNFVDHYLPYFRQWLITSLLSARLPFQTLFTESSGGDQLLAPPRFSSALTAPCSLCIFFFSFLIIIQGFLWGEWLVCPGGYAGLSQVWLWEYCMMLGADVSQADLELASAGVGALLFSQCNIVWRSFLWAGGSGVELLILLGAFFCQVWLQHLSKILDLQSSCCLLLPSSRHLGASLFLILTACFSFMSFCLRLAFSASPDTWARASCFRQP
jgi:hypothetical protein